MGALYLGIKAIGWHEMIKNWWDKLLAAVLLATIVLGAVSMLYSVYQSISKSLKARHERLSKVPKAINVHLKALAALSAPFRSEAKSVKEPKTFGVFLGSFANPPTLNQKSLLSQWEILVLDPLQVGVLDALSSQAASLQVLGRLDVGAIAGLDCGSGTDVKIEALDRIAQTLATHFKRPQDDQSPFTGVLLANWHAHFQPLICNELMRYLNRLNFDVYLEIAPPAYLKPVECHELDMDLVRGMVCRNGTIMANGDRRNYFQMAEMRAALRALAKRASNSTVMMWETIDEGVVLSHGVVKRSFNWCRFNTALSWIGPQAALNNAEIAAVETVKGDPLGALMWLKSNETMAAHDIWRLNDKICRESAGHEAAYQSLEAFVPDLAAKLSLLPASSDFLEPESQLAVAGDYEPSLQIQGSHKNPFSFSPSGNDYTGLGCFQLGLDCSSKDFADLVEGQQKIRDLDLLELLKPEELLKIREQLLALANTPGRVQAFEELLELLSSCSGDKNDRLKVYVGLQSGFHSNLNHQFWGLYDVNQESESIEIYISGKTKDRAGTILHTFLSSRHYTRTQCFMAEIAVAGVNGTMAEPWILPPRLVQDIEQLTPTESMLFLQRLTFNAGQECKELSARIRACCEYQLMEVPSLSQLRALNTSSYLRGDVSAEELIVSRLGWFRERGCQHPNASAAVALFKEIDARLPEVLRNQEAEQIAQLDIVLEAVLKKGRVDASADVFALAVFCAFRRLAIDEVYLEVLDRNPLPNPHADQAACFSEMFALGSQCESYFDMTSNVLGKILSDRYHAYYMEHQPPQREDATTELPTAYSSSQVDQDPKAGRLVLPVHYQITFLGIFAVPALIDITLLTTIGRGLYLSTYMSETEKVHATAGLMAALLLTGAVGTWIGNGGSYYLHCMAFPAMNMFVLTRFVAGIALNLSVGIFIFILIGAINNFYSGVIFFLYFVFLSTYLILLATLSIYQLPGFMFQSGRTTVIMCIPILFISPLITLWVHHHDIVVYLCVLVGFLAALLLGARSIISQWSSWYLHVPIVSDTDVVNWYTKSVEDKSAIPEGVTDLAATPYPRRALTAAILAEQSRKPWTKSTADELVTKLTKGHSASMFLMDWYCKYSRTSMPYLYSPTWNLQVKAAVDTLKDMQKGLKLHNAFMHWRHGGNEVWCGVLYFVIALMDKWIALVTGGSLVGLSDADSNIFRLSVGFGLAYYLIAAVCLDTVAQPLWALANKKTSQPITSLEYLRQAAVNDLEARRRLYWGNFVKFLGMHIWGLSIGTALMWTFEDHKDAIIMFLAYVGAYTGLLWYQYNRIYCGTLALKDLVTAAIVGIVVGVTLNETASTFEFSNVVALASATWTAAILSMFTARIGLSKISDKKAAKIVKSAPVFHTSSVLGPYLDFSQRTLTETFDSVLALPADYRYRLDPKTHPGVEVVENLRSQGTSEKPSLVQAAFPSGERLVEQTVRLWMTGEIVVELVPARRLLRHEDQMRAVSRTTGDKLHIMVLVGLDLSGEEWIVDIRRNCKVIAESIIQAAAESKFGLSHDHSSLAEVLASGSNGVEALVIPEGVKRQLELSPSERSRVIESGDKEVLRHMLLGLNCDVEWDLLPRTVRSFLLKRCCGEAGDVTDEQAEWIRSRFCSDDKIDIEEHVARANLGAALTTLINSYAQSLEVNQLHRDRSEPPASGYERFISAAKSMSEKGPATRPLDLIKRPFLRLYFGVRLMVKFLVVSLVADPEFQRELDYVMMDKNFLIRWPTKFILNGIWNYAKTLQNIILPLSLLHNREHVSSVYRHMLGIKAVMEKNKITIDGYGGPSTCFIKIQDDGSSQFHQYSGRHSTEPTERQNLMAINTYTENLILRQREEYDKQSLLNMYTYEYPQAGPTAGSKLPISRQCIKGQMEGQIVEYDQRGYITCGSYIKDDNLVSFKLWYRKNAKFDDELLHAEFVLQHMKIQVAWSVPPPRHPEKLHKWIPDPNVMEATFTEGNDRWVSYWDYDHRSHPVITTTLNGEPVATPSMIQHDWFGILKKPKNCSFLSDNPLFSFNSMSTSIFSRILGSNTKRYPVSTSRARTHLWKSWKEGKQLDAVTVRWLDEMAMRSDSVMKPYWTARDLGRLRSASQYLDMNADAIMARVDVDPEISSWTPLAYKFSDLYSFGQGGDTRINTRTLDTQLQDSDEALHVLAMDTGTWPNEGGGVSACRRDMVNDLKTIRWHVLAECANDYGTPKFQMERNVQSITVLPLWGLDFLTPTHGVYQDCLDSEIQLRFNATTQEDILRNFIPILTTLVRCSRAIEFNRSHIEEATRALVDLNTYFESSRHWSEVWMSEIVKEKWRELWLCEDMENARPISDWLDAECPTLLHLDNALDMWHRYLFIFSVPVPERIPDVFQASHHFAGASYGVLCKVKRNCTLHVWDHCISWREVTVFLSSAMSFDSPFVCSSLIGLSRMASTLILHHADVVLPCADFFNPGWEVEVGTQEGTLGHRRTYARKIDPVVNGICNMEKFKPIEKIKSKIPTVTMLSHVRFVKDIKNAILAADIIVNEWGFTDYQLDIYGDMEKAPAYSVECKEILASKGLRDHVSLKGLGSPSKVLEEAWLFLNSSISEGLPLAMGEAALTGVPVVCTDVGASFRVVTDPVTWKKFSAVVAPNDAYSLAKAQVNVLALLDEWSEYAGDEPGYRPKMSLHPSKEEVASITKRMYEKTEQRRSLGMLGRANVLSSFSSDRYLREHEQMLWVGKTQSPSYLARSKYALPAKSNLSSSGSSMSGEKTPRNSGYGTPKGGRSHVFSREMGPPSGTATPKTHRSYIRAREIAEGGPPTGTVTPTNQRSYIQARQFDEGGPPSGTVTPRTHRSYIPARQSDEDGPPSGTVTPRTHRSYIPAREFADV